MTVAKGQLISAYFDVVLLSWQKCIFLTRVAVPRINNHCQNELRHYLFYNDVIVHNSILCSTFLRTRDLHAV